MTSFYSLASSSFSSSLSLFSTLSLNVSFDASSLLNSFLTSFSMTIGTLTLNYIFPLPANISNSVVFSTLMPYASVVSSILKFITSTICSSSAMLPISIDTLLSISTDTLRSSMTSTSAITSLADVF